MSGHSVIIEIDSNSKLGNQYIPNDPHHISPNGKMLATVIDNHALIVANSLSKCTGLITRRRITKYRTEESCIDMLLFSSDLQQYFTSLLIDEKRKHVLTKIRNTKNGVIKKESDHHVLLSEFKDISFTTNKTNYTIYNLKNIVCQERFKEYTSQTKMLSSIFDSSDDINMLAKRFLKKLDGCIAINFKKIRVSHTKESDEDKLYKKMRELKDKEDNKSKTELDNIIKDIANLSEEKYQKVMEDLNSMKPSEGKIDSQKFWKIKRKMCKLNIDPPAAMFDSDGTLLTSNCDIQARALEVYTDRLKGNKIEKRLEDYEKEINELCKSRLKLCKLNKAKAWTMEDLDMAIKDLDRGKSRDALGYANEIIKDEVAGTDLKLATLRFMNHIRKEQKFPDCLQACNITSLYKNKGSRKDLMNYRGVFRVPLFRSILDRLMYNDLYTILDSNLTDGNVGARKGRNIRDNIFILGAVINSVTNGGEEPVQIQVVDVEKCFDKLWLEATTNALYEAGIRSDLLNLLYIENETAKIAVKVNGQLTKRVNVKNVEIQGSVWGSMKCTNTMDQLNKIILKQDHLTYHYKGDENIKIGVLGMIDDTLSISKCGTPSIQKNAVLNSFIETQRLTLSQDKSVALHIGKKSKCKQPCPILKVHNSNMQHASTVKYLGNIISVKGSNKDNIEHRRNRGWGKLAEISGLVSEMPWQHRLEVGLKMRESKLCNGILFSTEAWSSISDRDMDRLEQVDLALLKQLVDGHSKCSKVFYYLEFGVISLRHLIMSRRLMYHHHILTREDNETIKKVFMKQKESHLRGDWYKLIISDFEFIEEEIDEDFIKSIQKEDYREYINSKIKAGAYKYYMKLKEKSKKKLKNLKYEEISIQQYLTKEYFSFEEKKLLFSLRSQCYDARLNFRKLNKRNLKCRLNCHYEESQSHIFQSCQPILDKLGLKEAPNLIHIYGTPIEQKNAIKIFIQIDLMRKELLQNL